MINKKRYLVFFILFLVFVLYLFWGPLFPWNPIKIGFTKINSSRATIYISDMTAGDSIVHQINKLVLEEEAFHNLKYTDDIKIIILNKESDMKRYLPWLRGSGYSVSLSLVNVVYIGSTARKSSTGIEPYLKHELSHLLIDQNTTFMQSLKIHEQGWLTEGTAEYFSGHSFYNKSEFLEISKRNGLDYTGLREKNPLDMSVKDVRLNYSFYRFFIEFLIEKYGLPKFQEYLKSYIIVPQDYKILFNEIYDNDLNNILEQFRLSIN